MTLAKDYRWSSALEWYKETTTSGRDEEFLLWLFDNGYIDNDTIQNCFEKEMTADGFFVGNPTHPLWPLAPREQEADDYRCRACDSDFTAEEAEALENGTFESACRAIDDEGDDSPCAIRAWCQRQKTI